MTFLTLIILGGGRNYHPLLDVVSVVVVDFVVVVIVVNIVFVDLLVVITDHITFSCGQ